MAMAPNVFSSNTCRAQAQQPRRPLRFASTQSAQRVQHMVGCRHPVAGGEVLVGQHHQGHLAQMLASCAEPRTVLELMAVLFPRLSGRFDELMALGETLAHANYLVAENAILARGSEVERFAREVHALRDAVERLDKRLSALQGRRPA